MQLVSRFSCRLSIERNGVKLLGPKFQNSLFNISMHDNNKNLTISITAKNSSVTLPPSAYIPKVFTEKNISSVYKQCLDQGRLTIILINYDSSVQGYKAASTISMQTSILISEAPVEALRHFWISLQQGPSKRKVMDQHDDREAIRKKPKTSVWNKLNLDVIRIIFQFIGGKIGDFGLVSRGWSMMISELTRKVKFNYTKDITGEILVRIIKRNPFLTHVSMKDCKNFQVSHMKKAVTLPLKRVLVLDVENCKKINSQCLFLMIREGFNITSLNALDTLADDDFFNYINTTLHLKHLTELRFGNIGEMGALNLSTKFHQITKLELHLQILSHSIAQHIFSMKTLLDLRLYYQECKLPREIEIKCKLSQIEILQEDTPRTSSSSLNLWLSLKSQPSPLHIGCNLPKDSLLFLFETWPSLKSARLTDYTYFPESLKHISLYYPEDLDDEISERSDTRFLSTVKTCELIVKVLEPYENKRIINHFKTNYPHCSLSLTIR